MKDSPLAGTLAAEFLGVLLAYPGASFAPGELANTLRCCPAWGAYLANFEAERGQPAAIGRYLNELGLAKSGHHRTRGSLYSSQAVLGRLQEVVEAARRVRHEMVMEAEAITGAEIAAPDDAILQSGRVHAVAVSPAGRASGVNAAETTQVIGFLGGVANTMALSPQEVLSAAPGLAPTSEAQDHQPGAMEPELPQRRQEDRRNGADIATPGGAAAAAAPARSAPVIGWRRRATDLARTPRPAGGGEASAAAAPVALPPAPPPYTPGVPYAYNAAGSPPMWVGGGAAFGPPGMPHGALAPYAPPAEINPATSAEEAGLPLSFYWTQIRRHLYKILLASLVITGLAGFYTLRIPKLYESVVTLRMDFQVPAVAADAASNPAFDPSTLIQTEVTDVTQRGVLLDAINAGHLDLNTNLLRQIKQNTGVAPTVANPAALDDALVGLMAGATSAVSPDNTHNIDIHYKSLDPATSANVANAIANALISHEFTTRQQEQDQSLAFMNKQFQDINARMETEQNKLTEYQHQNNILNPDGQSTLENTALTTLQGDYLTVQGELTKLQAEQDILKSGQPTDALLASDDGSVLRPTYDALQAAQLKFNQIKSTRGPANPEYQAAQQGVTQAQKQLDVAMDSVRNQINAQFLRVQKQAALVATQLQQARTTAQNFNDKAIDYNVMKRDLDADQKLHDDLEAQIKQQQLTASLSSSGLRVTNLATPNPAPVYPDVRKNVMLALLFSLFLGCGLAVLAGYLDRSFTSPDGVEQYLRIPLLGALPVITNKSNLIELAEHPSDEEAAKSGKATPRSAFAESILMLRTAVLYAAPHGFRTLCVTSAQPQEGKSVILANLAIALALHGSKVLLIDADIRRPTQHRIFEVNNQVGLSSLLRQSAPLDECFHATTVEKLYLMPAGPAVPNPSELVATMLAQVLTPLTAEFDYVLVDSPPVLGFADAVSISTVVEGTLLVARAGKTQRELVHAALQPLKRVRARVLGLILNQVSSSLNPYYSYYRDHYARYYGERDTEASGE